MGHCRFSKYPSMVRQAALGGKRILQWKIESERLTNRTKHLCGERPNKTTIRTLKPWLLWSECTETRWEETSWSATPQSSKDQGNWKHHATFNSQVLHHILYQPHVKFPLLLHFKVKTDLDWMEALAVMSNVTQPHGVLASRWLPRPRAKRKWRILTNMDHSLAMLTGAKSRKLFRS